MPHFRILAGVVAALIATSARAEATRKAPVQDGYQIPYVVGPGGEKRSVMDTPGGVTVISRKFMDDIQARSIYDALRYAPGVRVLGR
ncbi:TonB-dependent receptor plug domain-containing protein [Methylosinus sporium]|uniref:TonB-dependent receptor plug domain-containing protein n=1 Tax=Methylosinus sporium TaxID=428 RepID=UPI00383B3CB0